MTDPKRWLEDRAAASSLEARILAAGSELTPPAGLMERSYADFAALVGIADAGNAGNAVGAGQSAGTAAGGASLTAGVLKAVGLGLLLGTLTMTSVELLGRESPAADKLAVGPAVAVRALSGAPAAERAGSPAPSASTSERALPIPDAAKALARETNALANNEQASSAARAATGSELLGEGSTGAPSEKLGTPVATSAAFPAEPAPAQAVTASSASLTAEGNALKAEALELAQAKNLLQQGLASEALTLLVGGTKRFAKSVLRDERELLTVQALSSLGRREQARERARSFLASHRDGPISLRMQRLIEQK